jgi:hypothetical protein
MFKTRVPPEHPRPEISAQRQSHIGLRAKDTNVHAIRIVVVHDLNSIFLAFIVSEPLTNEGLEGCQLGPNLLIQESPAFTARVHMSAVALVAGKRREKRLTRRRRKIRRSGSQRRGGGGAPSLCKGLQHGSPSADKSVSLVIKLPWDCSIRRRLDLIERMNEGCWHCLCTELPRIQVLGNVADIVAFFRGGIHVF